MIRTIILLLSICCFVACSDSETAKSTETAAAAVSTKKVEPEKKGVANPPAKTEEDDRKVELDKIKLPDGFKIEVYAEKVKNARSMSLSPSGTLFIGSMRKGNVYAAVDKDGDHKAETIYTLAKGLNMPNGVAFKDGSLYVAEVNRILRYDDIENKLDNPGEPVVVYDKYPTETHHGWKYIAFGPDGKLYVPVGAPCNICESEDKVFASITRMDPDGSNMEVVQSGVRNTVGFNWHPDNNELWFTDNGRDWLGDDLPACEVNHAPKDGMHFGYPYCHQGDFKDPEFGDKRSCDEFTAPAQNLGAHVAPLGIEFYTGKSFPEKYAKQIFIAEHGSWNRSKKSGYQISLLTLENNKVASYEPFITGWVDAAADSVWGRPVDIEWMPDGSMLISDDYANVIYRVSYQK